MLKTKVAVLVGTLAVSGIASADLSTGLIAHWSFDDCTAKDVSGNGHNGEIKGTPQCVVGEQGQAFQLNGTTDFIQGAIDNTAFAKNWSIVANFKRTDYNSAWDAIFSNTWDTPDAPVMTFQNIGTNFLGMNRVGMGADGAFTNLGGKHINKWVFAVLSMKNGVVTIRAYLDGKMRTASRVWWADTIQTSGNFLIGRHWLADTQQTTLFKGIIDNVKVYNRALSTTEISVLYALTKPVGGTLQGFNSYATT